MKAIETKYHGPGNTKGSRYSASDGDARVYVAYDYALNSGSNHAKAALEFMRRKNWHGKMVGGGTKSGMVWVFLDSDEIIEG